MTSSRPEKEERQERNREIALFRYGLIAPLPAGQLEAALRQLAAKTYHIPYSKRRQVSVSTLRRYLALYQKGGCNLNQVWCADTMTPLICASVRKKA